MRRRPLWAACIAVGVVALVAAARSVVIVDQTEAVYVTEFGRPVRLIDEPGLHWKWPYQSRRGFDRRLQLDAPPPREMLTKDKKNLEVAWYVSWKIADVERFLRVGPDACPTPRRGSRTWRRRSWRPSWAGTTCRAWSRSSAGSALDALMKDVTGADRRAGGQGVRPEGRRRPAAAAELSRGGPLGGLRADPQRAEAGGRGDPGRGREPGPHDPQRRRPASGPGRVAEAEADAARLIGEGEAQATRIANDAHAADPAFYQFLKTLETYRAALDSRRRRSSSRPTARSSGS